MLRVRGQANLWKITNVPTSLTTDEGLLRIVDEVQKETIVPTAAIARNVKDLPDLIEEHEDLVRELEAVLAKYLKNPDKLPPNRPLCKPSKKDPEYVKGQKVDAIDYLTNRIQRLEKKIMTVRNSVDQRNAMPYGFVSYDNIEEAHAVGYAGRKKHPHGANLYLAPRPGDIIWKNLSLTPQAKRMRRVINQMWMALLTLAWVVPNALIAVFLANLTRLGQVWPAFQTQLIAHKTFWAVVQGVAAPILTSLAYFYLPTVFRRLSIKAGDHTKTSRERHVTARLYGFFVFNNLIIFTLFGVIWSFVAALLAARAKDESLVQSLQEANFWNKAMQAMIAVSPFWTTYLLQRNLGAAIDLSQFVNLAWGSFQRRFMSPTPRKIIELSAPPPFDYASYYNYFLFYTTVGLCFATIQPIVLPVTAFYFVLDAWLKTYLVLYVFVTKNESGGLFWRVLFNRMLFAAFLSNLIIAMMVYAQKGGTGVEWITMLCTLAPLPVLLILFKIVCSRMFDAQIKYFNKGVISQESLANLENKSRQSDRLGARFGHPALYQQLMTPMVHAKSQHLLAEVYNGRLDDDDTFSDTASTGGYSDAYSMHTLNRDHKRSASATAAALQKQQKKKKKNSPFEFVNESDLNFENFKDRPEFRAEFGGSGGMYGGPEDLIRAGTPPASRSGLRSASGDSDRTLSNTNSNDANLPGTLYAAGYNTPAQRGYSPSPDRGAGAGQLSRFGSAADLAGQGQQPLMGGAAPMGVGRKPLARMVSSESESEMRGRRF
jgi:hypothetical protein